MKREDLYKGPVSWMARNPVPANMLMIALLVGGVVAAFSVRQEVFPQIALDQVDITVVYPGASPEEVEKGILLSVEEAVRPLDGVKEVRSTARESMGQVSVELQRGANRNKALTDVKNAIDRITSFPEEAERPIVNMPEWRAEAISLILYGDVEEKVLHELGEQVRDELLALPDVSMAELDAVRPMEIGIEVPQAELRKHKLTLPQIARLVRGTAIEVPAGGVKTKGGEWLLRTAERRELAREYATVPVVAGGDGTPVLLGDIADIQDGYAETDVWAAFEGKRAVMINVTSVGDQSPPEVAEAVKAHLKVLEPRLPPGIKATSYLDRSKLYDERVDLLLRNAMLGLALVLVILGLFLELRLAFWVTMGIPISFLGSLILLPALDVSLNMISLFAFIVTLGMVVDDAIVVGENAFRFRREGHSPLKAAILGVKQVAVPVFFSITTTVVFFMPLLFVPGIRGKFFLPIPIVVILVLVLSLIESFFVLPAHLAHIKSKKDDELGPIARAQVRVSRAIEHFISRFYLPVVRLAVRQRWITLALALAVFLSSLGLIWGGHIKFISFPKEESDWIVAVARMPFGIAVEETEAVMDRMVRAAKDTITENGGEQISLGVFSMVGVGFGGRGGGGSSGSHMTSVLITLVPTDQRPISSHDFADVWREKIGKIAGLESMTFDATTGHGSSKPIDLKLSHRNSKVIEEAARALATEFESFKGLKDIDSGIELGKPQLDFTLTTAGINAGFTSAELAAQVRAAFYGAEALRQQRGRNEIRTLVRLPRADRESLHSVEELIVQTPTGGEMPLRVASHVAYGRAYTAINRTDGKRNLRVQADINEDQANEQEVMTALFTETAPKLKAKFPGLTVEPAGQQKDHKEFGQWMLVAGLIALLAMLIIIAIPLKSYIMQPVFVVMMAIPFGFTGALLGHLLMGMSWSMISWMGFFALMGVVVNDSLVLTSTANRLRDEEGLGPLQAATKAAHLRFRPVILTSLTTFGGLAPMIFETSVQARVIVPMAVSLGFGVLFSTLVVLVLVPSMFAMVENGRGNLRRAWNWLFHPTIIVPKPPEPVDSELKSSGETS